ncbi:MAG: DUF1840 domain-containing protein [Zoogloeaceae bacterium]|jgi:hypothetical protein|nr:DUF1840 domain-containing protein [Zoogloeaceae bacterium]
MLVTFTSSESGTMLMFAEVARPFLKAMGKDCSARGVITQAEMPAAIAAIERYLKTLSTAKSAPKAKEKEEEEEDPAKPRVSAAQRAWPLLDMLARSLKSKKESHILWEASADFSEDEDEDGDEDEHRAT